MHNGGCEEPMDDMGWEKSQNTLETFSTLKHSDVQKY